MDKYFSHKKLNALITSLTIIIMFWAITYYHEKIHSNMPYWVAFLISSFASSGVFTFIALIFQFSFENIKKLKALVLGKHFLEGHWVGFVETSTEVHFVVERFDQNMDGLIITGKSYFKNDNNELIISATWKSTVSKLSYETQELQYSYLNTTVTSNEPVQKFDGFGRINYHKFRNEDNEFRQSINSTLPLYSSFSLYGQLHDFDPNSEMALCNEIKITDSLDYELDYFNELAYSYWQFHHRRLIIN